MQNDLDLPVADRIDGLLQPYENNYITGQHAAESLFLQSAAAGRTHHAWLLTGPKGIGKATLAFRLARGLVECAGGVHDLTGESLREHADTTDTVFRKVASGGHPNILHLRIPLDEKTRKFKTQITVDEVRRTVRFFGSTAGESGWRVAVIDNANEMNINASNALLKILEEPPERTVFFVLADQPGRLLPTIRSRCQYLPLLPLGEEDLASALTNASDLAEIDIELLRFHRAVINGSVRAAHQFLANDTAVLFQEFEALCAQYPNYDIAALHKFADIVSTRGADEKYHFFIDFIQNWIAQKVREKGSASLLVRWVEVWDKVQKRFDLEDRLNIDRKQTVLAIFDDISTLDLI